MSLDASARLDDPDGLLEALFEAQRGLSPEAALRFNARLILLLANQIGSGDVIREAIAAALAAASPDKANNP